MQVSEVTKVNQHERLRTEMPQRQSIDKNKGAMDCSIAPWLVPSPRYFAKLTAELSG